MLTLEAARELLLSSVRPAQVDDVSACDAVGRVLAEDLFSKTALPPFDQSAMDGYAVALRDLPGEGPWCLPVNGESRAGTARFAFTVGTACRIFTGAPLPAGADTVVMQEHVERRGDEVLIGKPVSQGAHIRRAGDDMRASALALPKGARLTPGHIALAQMVDAATLRVARRPRVSILCTGTELRAPGTEPRQGLIPESNSAAIAALARAAGADVQICAAIGDDLATTERAIRSALQEATLLVTIGGVSVGDYDFVRPAMEKAGIALDFWKVAIRPGKPLVVGRTATAHALGLPGNPSSALVTFALFGMPLLRAMQGDLHPLPMPLPAELTSACRPSADRVQLLRARLGRAGPRLTVTPHANQSSGAATSLADSDVLALIPAADAPTPAGATVDVIPWSAF